MSFAASSSSSSTSSSIDPVDDCSDENEPIKVVTYRQYTQDQLIAALSALRPSYHEAGLSLDESASRHQIPLSTLTKKYRRFRDALNHLNRRDAHVFITQQLSSDSSSLPLHLQPQSGNSYLSPAQESSLVNWIIARSHAYLAVGKSAICSQAHALRSTFNPALLNPIP